MEKINHLIKQQITKICQESNSYWYQALRIVLMRIRIKPRSKESLSPFEILYGRPYQFQFKGEDLNKLGENYLQRYMIALGNQLSKIQKEVWGVRGLDQPIHPFKPRDWVHAKALSGQPLEEKDHPECCRQHLLQSKSGNNPTGFTTQE